MDIVKLTVSYAKLSYVSAGDSFLIRARTQCHPYSHVAFDRISIFVRMLKYLVIFDRNVFAKKMQCSKVTICCWLTNQCQ